MHVEHRSPDEVEGQLGRDRIFARTNGIVFEHAHGGRRPGTGECVKVAGQGLRQKPHMDDAGLDCSERNQRINWHVTMVCLTVNTEVGTPFLAILNYLSVATCRVRAGWVLRGWFWIRQVSQLTSATAGLLELDGFARPPTDRRGPARHGRAESGSGLLR